MNITGGNGGGAIEKATRRVLDLLLFLVEIQFHRDGSGGSGARQPQTALGNDVALDFVGTATEAQHR